MVATKRDVAPKEPNPKKQKVGKVSSLWGGGGVPNVAIYTFSFSLQAVKQQVKTPETSRPVDGGSTSRSGRVIKVSFPSFVFLVMS
jgi:hypothetical protein